MATLIIAGCGRSAGKDPTAVEHTAAGPRYDIPVGQATAHVEMAATAQGRETGLMFRRKLEPDSGMLFVFGGDEPLAFWMKNTYLELDVAFARADGTIVKIDTMKPLTTRRHSSGVACRYALEMPTGWFKRHDIAVGDRIQVPSQVLEIARKRIDDNN